MTKRLLVGALLLATLGLLAGACGGSDDKADETTTTKKDTTTTEAGDDASDPDDTTEEEQVGDDEFDAQVGEVAATVESANGDVCVLMSVLTEGTTDLPNPSTPAQVKTATAFVAQVLNAIADSSPPENAAQAETIRSTATQVEADAADHDYDPEWFNSSDYDPLSSEESMAALTTFYEVATTNCATGDTPATAPAG
ncbi:MAG: hypothetical protein ACYC2O_11990 [Microthrixaceae bacterium]